MKKVYAETPLETKYGNFVIRVYADTEGKETVVLRTVQFDPRVIVLVRIHSECFTGDTLGSLKCDCGEQLEQSLRLIFEQQNGVLIYLRQEGRGIGLFEKIKSYQLQAKGVDTHEANLLLGHKPDVRSYEWAKIALDDLCVRELKLLTNNPAKVSALSELGFEVVERIPIVTTPNEYNKKYLDAKRDKFKHYFDSK